MIAMAHKRKREKKKKEKEMNEWPLFLQLILNVFLRCRNISMGQGSYAPKKNDCPWLLEYTL
jgi:hypothetical protein